MSRWRALLDRDLRDRAWEAIESVARELREPVPAVLPEGTPSDFQPIGDASLAGGAAGTAILFAYLARSRPGKGHEQTALRHLNRSVELIAQNSVSPSLFGGFSGTAWVSEHLKERAFPAPQEDPNQEIDDALARHLEATPWTGEYDLISGLVGIGVYALERLPRSSAARCLSLVVDRLSETSVRQPEGTAWWTPAQHLPSHQRALCPEGYFNLGVAHGIPGVLALLAGAATAGIGRARELLEASIPWLRFQRGRVFPYWVGPGIEAAPSRSAWCYGDPGIAAALHCAGRATGRRDWERDAIEISLSAAARPEKETGVEDAGLCHGAGGLAHIFNRLYQATGEEPLGIAAREWYQRTLEMRRADNPGFLSGSAGVALALLAAVTPIEPEWDRLLLLSLANGDRRQA